MISCIAAMNHHGTLGLDGQMPWHNPEDLKHFKSYTMGKTLVMGRKTFEGLPKKLQGRNILIVSKHLEGEHIISDLEKFLIKNRNNQEEIVIAGGGEIYKAALPYCDRLVLSFINDNDIIGDTFFPNFNQEEYNIINRKEFSSFIQITYERKDAFK